MAVITDYFDISEDIMSQSEREVERPFNDYFEFLFSIALNENETDYENIIHMTEDLIKKDSDNAYRYIKVSNDTEPLTVAQLSAALKFIRIFNQDREISPNRELFSRLIINGIYSFNDYYTDLRTYLMGNYPDKYDLFKVSQYVADLTDDLTIFATKYILFQQGSTISLFDLISIYKNVNPRLKELMMYSGGEEEEDTIASRTALAQQHQQEAIDIIMSTHNPYRDYIKAGAGINQNQWGEVFLNIMYKPDAFGTVIPYPIYRSFAQGLNSVRHLYIDGEGARTALITSKIQVRKSGYFNRKLNSMMSDLKVDFEHGYDCGTKFTVKYDVKSRKRLAMIEERYIVLPDGSLHLVTANDTNLIGQTVELRSPITCAADGDTVCQVCYGKLAMINSHIDRKTGERKSDGVGGIGVLHLTEPFTQKLLSTKHLLRVNVDEIPMPDGYENFLNLRSNRIYLSEAIKAKNIYIPATELDENTGYETDKYSTYKVGFGNKIYEFEDRLIINDEFMNEIQSLYNPETDAYEFNQKVVKENWLFKIIVRNNGIADPLMKVKNALEFNTFMKQYGHDYEKLLDYVDENLIASKTSIRSVHIENIIRDMVYFGGRYNQTFNHKELLEMDEIPSYEILNITDAILFGNSPVKAVLYQNINKLFTSDSLNLLEKRGESNLDSYFK